MWGPRSIAKLVFNFNNYGLWYANNYSYWGESKPTYNWGASHCRYDHISTYYIRPLDDEYIDLSAEVLLRGGAQMGPTSLVSATDVDS